MTYEVYASIKIEGPAYVPGSTKPNAFSIDRLILVEVTETGREGTVQERNTMTRIRDMLWIWGQDPNGHHLYNLPGTSKMSALEGAYYLGVRNCCRVVMTGTPLPPWDQDSRALVSLDRVVWSVIGSGGSKRNDAGDGTWMKCSGRRSGSRT